VQSRSLTTAGLHRSHFNVVVWKLISEMQACLQSINEPSMLRFYSSINSDHVMLIRQDISRDVVLHENTRSIAAATLNEDRMSGSVPDRLSLS
jgi:hypothetical protein